MNNLAHRCRRCLVAIASCCAFAWAGAAFAQATDDAVVPRFSITRFDVTGNTLLTPEEIESSVREFVGQQKDFSDIQRALENLEQTYRDRGYGVVQVLLPEQDITKGVVTLRVIEPKIGKVIIEGNKFFDDANIRRSLPRLRPGATPNSEDLARNLQMLQEQPAKQTTVLLKAGENESLVDANVKVADEKPLRYLATFDNTGTDDTGRFRTGISMQHSNMFNRDHVLSLQYITNPENPSKVQIYGGGYRIPFYEYNSSLEVYAGYSDVSSGTLQGLFNVSGSGTIAGGRYNLYLPKFGELEHRLSFGIDYRAFQNQVTQVGSSNNQVPDVTVLPVSIGYNGLWRMPTSELGFYGTLSANVPGLNDGGDNSFKAVRTNATPTYRIFRWGASYTRALPYEWQFRAVANGQYTNDALIPGEQFGFGGPDSVRGFNVREVSNDWGWSSSVELYTPDLGTYYSWKNIKMRLLAFFDMGTTTRNSPQPGESFGQSGSSTGFGMRMTYGKNLNLRLDFAQVIDPAGSQSRRDQMLHAAVAVPF